MTNGDQFKIGSEHTGEDSAQLIRSLLDIIHGVLRSATRLQLLVVHRAHCGIHLCGHWSVAPSIQIDTRLR
jgi:hypothetical protein